MNEVQQNLFPKIKLVDEEIEVVFEMELNKTSLSGTSTYQDERSAAIQKGLDHVNTHLSGNQAKLDELNEEINRFTNQADTLDYAVAISSGILTGFLDAFWVGEFSLDRGKKWSSERVNNFVVKIAQSQGYKGDDLPGAIRFLEDNYGAPSDGNTSDYGGGLQHHLRDFAHHPTLVGLLFSLITQFTEKAYGTDTNGVFKVVTIKDTKLIGKDVPQKLLFGVVYWFFHMVSDIAGSRSTPGAGTGLPGPLLSLAKELSVLPLFQNMKFGDYELSVWISKLFNGTLLGKRDENGKIQAERFDFRAELGVIHELGRQAIPVVLNEVIVRGFYFIRQLATELKVKDIQAIAELNQVDWKKTLPARNRTVVRMLTIATGTFTAIDLADAAIRAGMKSGANLALFTKQFLLRVNVVGVGRFAVAVSTDTYMGMKQQKLRNERIVVMGEQMHVMNAKAFYLQADAWIAAETTEQTISHVYELMEETTQYLLETQAANSQSLQKIADSQEEIERKNPGLVDEMKEMLKWG